LALVLCLVGGVGLMVRAVTATGPAVPVPPLSGERLVGDSIVQIEAGREARVVLSLEGRQIMEAIVHQTIESTVALPSEGADLVVRVRSSDGGRLPVRVSIGQKGRVLAERTLWGEGEFAGVVKVPPP
jgi:hypothetical protein